MKFNNRNVYISPKAKIGYNVKIGDNTIIYDNVIIGDNTIICNDCVLGEPLNEYYHNDKYHNPVLEIGANSLIRSHCIFYAGSKIGDGLTTGHHVTVRENTIAGINCQFGTNCDIQGSCRLGNYVKMQSSVIVGQGSLIGNYVFLYPYVVLTNDPTPPSNTLAGVSIDDFSVITTGTIVLPDTQIGKHSLVAANSAVSGHFTDDSFIAGNPARCVSKLSKTPFFDWETHKRHYPWPKNFKRGMPWNEIGFDKWNK